MSQARGYSVWIIGTPQGQWTLEVMATDIFTPSRKIDHERTRRTYSSPGDAATSLRHLLNELDPTSLRHLLNELDPKPPYSPHAESFSDRDTNQQRPKSPSIPPPQRPCAVVPGSAKGASESQSDPEGSSM